MDVMGISSLPTKKHEKKIFVASFLPDFVKNL